MHRRTVGIKISEPIAIKTFPDTLGTRRTVFTLNVRAVDDSIRAVFGVVVANDSSVFAREAVVQIISSFSRETVPACSVKFFFAVSLDGVHLR